MTAAKAASAGTAATPDSRQCSGDGISGTGEAEAPAPAPTGTPALTAAKVVPAATAAKAARRPEQHRASQRRQR
ncbi:hypothetical protein [Mycobacterium tuberculosis]|uniref:hypothetical protein n=1 Tax=Mycobacterium tuberculosis TaxID=1773 RepID=UPI0032B3EA06